MIRLENVKLNMALPMTFQMRTHNEFRRNKFASVKMNYRYPCKCKIRLYYVLTVAEHDLLV